MNRARAIITTIAGLGLAAVLTGGLATAAQAAHRPVAWTCTDQATVTWASTQRVTWEKSGFFRVCVPAAPAPTPTPACTPTPALVVPTGSGTKVLTFTAVAGTTFTDYAGDGSGGTWDVSYAQTAASAVLTGNTGTGTGWVSFDINGAGGCQVEENTEMTETAGDLAVSSQGLTAPGGWSP